MTDNQVTENECRLQVKNLTDALETHESELERQRETDTKLSKILLGNGHDGVLGRLTKIETKSTILYAGIMVIVGVVSSIVTAYLIHLFGGG